VRRRESGGISQAARRRAIAAAALAAAAVTAAALTGCAKMDAALSKQWMVVDFSPSTTIATALQVRSACSHISNAPPMALPAKHSVINIMYGVRYDTTNASPANLAQLQTCLQRFKSVAGLNPQAAGDEGS
jgi:hypothetical protein